MNLESACILGIDFFLSKHVAELYGLDEKNLQNGVLEGWYKNGAKAYKFPVVNGVRHGLQEHWYEDGYKEQVMRIDGKRQGPFYMWYPTGNKCNETNYVDDEEQGLNYGWHENGKKHYESLMRTDNIHGNYYYSWDKNGKKIGSHGTYCVIA